MVTLNAPLSNAQLEVVQLFSMNLDEEELKDLKRLLIAYKSERLARKINEHWDKKDWSQDTMDVFLDTHLRTAYQSQSAFLAKQTKQ
jgi:ribosomal protein L11 methylase PrmA